MRKTKLSVLFVVGMMLLGMVLSGCGGTVSSTVDTAKVEKTVLSAMNKALGTEFSNNESLRGNTNIIWDYVDQAGKISVAYSWYSGNSTDGKSWIAEPMIDTNSFDTDAKFQMIAITAEQLKNYENPSDELLAQIKKNIAPTNSSTEISSICVTARNIGGKVYVVYVRELQSK